MCVCGQVKGTRHVIEVVTALGSGRVTELVTFLFQFISDNYITHLHPSIASQYYCSVGLSAAGPLSATLLHRYTK